jgi:hypothetical protein
MASSRPLQQRRFGNANVIYLTLSMRVTVRVLSAYLTAWLMVAAAFPPCCWSMASYHNHHPQSASVDASAAPHTHHSGHMPGSATTSPSSSVIRQDVRQPCDAAPADAVATSTASLSRTDVPRMVPVTEAREPHSSRTYAHPPDLSPPCASSGSAFLNPLRI